VRRVPEVDHLSVGRQRRGGADGLDTVALNDDDGAVGQGAGNRVKEVGSLEHNRPVRGSCRLGENAPCAERGEQAEPKSHRHSCHCLSPVLCRTNTVTAASHGPVEVQ